MNSGSKEVRLQPSAPLLTVGVGGMLLNVQSLHFPVFKNGCYNIYPWAVTTNGYKVSLQDENVFKIRLW